MPSTYEGPPLSGDLVSVSFWSDRYLQTIQKEYDELIAKHGPNRVLILNRYPAGTQELEDNLAAAAEGIERPQVDILAEHAARVVDEMDTQPRLLGQDEQAVLIHEFLDGYDWDHPYLETAAQKDGFKGDFIRFVVTASYQQRPPSVSDEVLSELYDAVDAYHEFCLTELPAAEDLRRGFIDRSSLLTTALELLSEDDVREQVCLDFDAVLALEFEEFDRTSRAYLAKLTHGCELVAVAQRNSAIRRPFSEAGEITDVTDSLTHRPVKNDHVTDPLQAVAAYLGASPEDVPNVPLSAVASRIEGNTFQSHVKAIGREIERLHRLEGVSYDDVAVVLRDSDAPVSETNSVLRGQGIPTTSATVSGLEHDPCSRELLALARALAAEAEPSYDRPRAVSTLKARLRSTDSPGSDNLDQQIEHALKEAAAADTVHAGLARWIVHSDLKERVASNNDPLEARIRFNHLRRLIQLTKFLSEEPISADWDRVVAEFEQRFELESRDQVSDELDTVSGAVRVDVARAIKTLDFTHVFLVGLVEGEYPHDPRFGSLFSREKLKRLPAFPTVTAPTTEIVKQTFPSARDPDRQVERRDPLDAYYGELSRRILAIGLRAAQDHVYLCTFEQERGLGQRRRPSRFLTEIESRFEPIQPLSEYVPETADPEEFAVTSVETALDRIRTAAIQKQSVDIDEFQREFGAVQELLNTMDDPELRRAVEAKIDFARGRVRRD